MENLRNIVLYIPIIIVNEFGTKHIVFHHSQSRQLTELYIDTVVTWV